MESRVVAAIVFFKNLPLHYRRKMQISITFIRKIFQKGVMNFCTLIKKKKLFQIEIRALAIRRNGRLDHVDPWKRLREINVIRHFRKIRHVVFFVFYTCTKR